jgi:uncharacterized protein (DUF58 family)
VGLVTFDEVIREYLPARNRTGDLRQLMLALEKPATGKGTDIAAPLKRMAELGRKRGLMVLITDFLSPLETLESSLALLTAARHEVLVFHLLDPAERDFKFNQPSRFQDLESGREMYLDPDAARPEYTRRLAEHQTASGVEDVGAFRWLQCITLSWKPSASIPSGGCSGLSL